MRGSIEVYQTHGDEDKLLFSEDNLIVEGGRDLIASMMAHRINPSAQGSTFDATGADCVSSFQINALSLGCARDYYPTTLSNFYHDISGFGPKLGPDVLNGEGNFNADSDDDWTFVGPLAFGTHYLSLSSNTSQACYARWNGTLPD